MANQIALRILTLRTLIYDYVGYLGGASNKEVALRGIQHGGKARIAGTELLSL